jgi:hypothetical protein
MQMGQTRRRFLTTVSMAGAAGLVRAPPVLRVLQLIEDHQAELLDAWKRFHG